MPNYIEPILYGSLEDLRFHVEVDPREDKRCQFWLRVNYELDLSYGRLQVSIILDKVSDIDTFCQTDIPCQIFVDSVKQIAGIHHNDYTSIICHAAEGMPPNVHTKLRETLDKEGSWISHQDYMEYGGNQ